ncbi:MAG: NAD(P)-dependent oxidoreductase [Aeromicrobium erythreum]
MRVVVTGANGFIGRAVGERLRADGHEVAGIDLSADGARGVVAGDLRHQGAWSDVLARADVVVHTAAIVSNAPSMRRAWEVNVLGTRHLVDAARSAGVRRVVHLSSVRAFSDLGFPDGVDETYPVQPDGNSYVDTRVASEQVVLQAHAAGELEATVVRPGDVYGPRSRPWTILPVQMIRGRRFMLPAWGRGVFSPVYADDLVDGVVRAATRDAAAGQVFTLAGGVGVPTAEFFGHYYRMLGRRGPLVLPTWAASGLAGAALVAATIARRETEMRPETVRYLCRRGTYSIAKARDVLGYAPAVGLAEGMARTEAWLRAEGLLD